MTPPSDSSRTSTVRIEFWYGLSPEPIRPVAPPEIPKTISIPASSRTRATSALAGISSVSICSMAIATSSLGGWRAELASSGGLRQRSPLVQNIPRIYHFPILGSGNRCDNAKEGRNADTQDSGRRALLRGARQRLSADDLRTGRAALGARFLAAQPIEPDRTRPLDGPDGGAQRQISGRRDGSAQCRALAHPDRRQRRLANLRRRTPGIGRPST